MQGADGQVSVGSFVYGGDRVNEEWRSIPGYEGYYEASTAGRIRSVDRMQTGRWGEVFHPSHILTPNDVHNGYQQVKFSIEGEKSQPLVHRLIAMTFLPNPDNLPQVNHKDGNPGNNNVSNLEWCTASENSLHRCRELKKRVGRPYRRVRCIDTGKVYESSHHAARELNISQGNIFSVCQGHWSTAGGKRFEFVG